MARRERLPGNQGDDPMADMRDSVPVPDPTTLTTENLLREIFHLRELLEAQNAKTRLELDSYVKTHDVKHADIKESLDRQFDDTLHRIAELDRRHQQRYEAQDEAVHAAFKAQETAVQAALQAADRAVSTAMDANEKAVAKAEALNARRMEDVSTNALDLRQLTMRLEEMIEKIMGLDRLTDAKFVTFRTLIDSQADKVALALAASDKAVSKAEVANEKRFESVNEFRAQLNDQANTFMPRTETSQLANALSARVDATISNIETSLNDIKSRLDRAEGKSGGYTASASALVAGVGFIATLIGIVTAILVFVN